MQNKQYFVRSRKSKTGAIKYINFYWHQCQSFRFGFKIRRYKNGSISIRIKFANHYTSIGILPTQLYLAAINKLKDGKSTN